MTSLISAADALVLSGTDKKRFTDASNEFRDRLRALNVCSDALLYSRTWADPQLFSARTLIPHGFPRDVREHDPPAISNEERIVIDFGSQNIISQYSNPLPPKCILLLRRDASQRSLSSDDRALISKCFQRLYCTLLAIKRTELRSGVLIRAHGETLDSFARHCLQLIDDILVSYEAASVFVPHKRGIPYLTMPATTKGIYQTRSRAGGGNPVRPLISMDTPVAKILKSSGPVVRESIDCPFVPESTDDNVDTIWNCVYLPLTFQRDNLRKLGASSDDTLRKRNESIGVLRITNVFLGPSQSRIARRVTWEDVYLLEFIAEIVFVLSRVFVTQNRYENEIERTLHGFQFLISGAHQNLTMIDRALKNGIPNRNEPPLHVVDRPGAFFSLSRAQNDISDAINFIEDMDFQFEKTTKRTLKRIEKEWVTHFHRDVLMVAVQNARRAAYIHGKKTVSFHFGQRGVEDETSPIKLPPVYGNKNAFISVLRNLFENSLKYAERNDVDPRVDVYFDATEKYVLFYVRDYGVGIRVEERPFIFNEGFRGSSAYDLGAIGSGLGLAYSKEIMRQYDGDLNLDVVLPPEEKGVSFVVKIRRNS